MEAEARRRMVLEALQDGDPVLVADLSRRQGVSEMTVRRDLEGLERAGLLRRIHGGAVSATSRGWEPPYALRTTRELDTKQKIGEVAAGLVADGDTVAIDVGTTALELARALADGVGLTVLTPSLRAAELLTPNPAIRTIVTGGIARHGELSLIGDLAERAFSELHCDIVFLGAGGVHPESGVTEFNLEDTRVKRAALASARRCVVLADSAKIGEVALASICPAERMDVLVTDDAVEEDAIAPFRELGVEVLVA